MLWSLFTTFVGGLPWVFIALAAFLTWQKKKKVMLIVQAAAGVLAFVIPLGGWLVMQILPHLNATWDTYRVIGMGFGFLEFLALLGFAGAYCAERFLSK